MINDNLLQVMKPARYIGSEWNVSKKKFDEADIRFALSFPDLYDVGMCNLGMRIIYGILNGLNDVCCERFFTPADDMQNLLKSQGLGVFSLESQKGIKEFDIMGFSLGSELDYTNVLNTLELGFVPIKSNQRGKDDPLVIAGGPCALNPEPMHEFIDLFVIGEAEDLILELIDVYRKLKNDFKSGKISRSDLLSAFLKIEGVYVPSFYEVEYSPEGVLEKFKPVSPDVPKSVKKRIVKNLDAAYFPVDWIVPYIQIIHDRITVEIMRGCPNRCRFCQARNQYYPYRVKSLEKILALAEKTYQSTGYEEISLCGLSVTDYPHIEELAKRLIELFQKRAVSISLPSIKAKAMVGELSSVIAGIKKTGLTFAPEAGSQRLRQLICKDFNEEEFFLALEQAYLAGYQHVKLYFMIGLPGEMESDLDAILDFANRVSQARRKTNKPPAQVNVSVNTFIPKPHTPFQWFAMDKPETVKEKQDYMRSRLRNRSIKINFQNREMSFLEAVLSAGDRRLSQVIFNAYKQGAKFDAWTDKFCFERWLEAFRQAGIDPVFYLRQKQTKEYLPWNFIDIGIDAELMMNEHLDTLNAIARG
ncbi:MAG: TIGR03960 family B12-binding radical SAM protein [Candidatus Omnitrophica bacterium]|nr:TIGR03960 family B12-binding radical SAM protein [Candidatus Omnitrophota bacterium]